MEASAILAERATRSANRRRHQERIKELVLLVDGPSGEMGPVAYVAAVREHGYDIDA